MITEETITRMKLNLEVKNEYVVLDVIKHLEGQIKKLKGIIDLSDLSERESQKIEEAQDILIKQLYSQIKRMKCCGNCKHREDCVYEHAWDLCDKWELAE